MIRSCYSIISRPRLPPIFSKLSSNISTKPKSNLTVDEIHGKESISSLIKPQRLQQTVPNDFVTVYKFPAVRYFSLINRLKVYHTGLAGAAAIGGTAFYAGGTIGGETLATICISGLSIGVCLYSLGYFAAQFIGFLYYNEEKGLVRIAYVDFWGRRRDVDVPISDIVPKSETPKNVQNFFWHPLQRYSTGDTWKLQLQQGKILDADALKKIL